MSAYSDIIIEATGVSYEDACVIEELIRVETPTLSHLDRRSLMREARVGKAQMELLAKDDPETLAFYRACSTGHGTEFIDNLRKATS